jgi:hypothetical protein
MLESRNLRRAERFLLTPPVMATFGTAEVAISDISVRGARFRHTMALEAGSKSMLQVAIGGRDVPLALEATVVWTQQDPSSDRFVSGVRTYAREELVQELLAHLHHNRRSSRIEEMRSADRFLVAPSIEAAFGSEEAWVEDLSARGARIETTRNLAAGERGALQILIPASSFSVEVAGEVRWSRIKSISQSQQIRYMAGLSIAEKPEIMRLAIGRLCELNRASLDTHSLRLKLKVFRARARQQALLHPDVEQSGVPAEQFLLVQGVREELRLNPEEAMHWYRRARFAIADPVIRTSAPAIADHPDALAVWEYLDRSIDPTIISRTFAWTAR